MFTVFIKYKKLIGGTFSVMIAACWYLLSDYQTLFVHDVQKSYIKMSDRVDLFPFFIIIFFICIFLIFLLGVFLYYQRSLNKQIDTLNEQNDKLNKKIDTLNKQIDPTSQIKIIPSLNQMVIEHDAMKPWEKIKSAKSDIILHAAYYPKYGIDSKYSEAFNYLLSANNNVKITVIITDIKAKWILEFGKILRWEFNNIESFKSNIDASLTFFLALQEKYIDRIKIVSTQRLPLMPFVIIGNEILIGNYCHSRTKAPDGLWMNLHNNKIPDIVNKIFYNKDGIDSYINNLGVEEKAIARYIEDAADAIDHGNIIEPDKQPTETNNVVSNEQPRKEQIETEQQRKEQDESGQPRKETRNNNKPNNGSRKNNQARKNVIKIPAPNPIYTSVKKQGKKK